MVLEQKFAFNPSPHPSRKKYWASASGKQQLLSLSQLSSPVFNPPKRSAYPPPIAKQNPTWRYQLFHFGRSILLLMRRKGQQQYAVTSTIEKKFLLITLIVFINDCWLSFLPSSQLAHRGFPYLLHFARCPKYPIKRGKGNNIIKTVFALSSFIFVSKNKNDKANGFHHHHFHTCNQAR